MTDCNENTRFTKKCNELLLQQEQQEYNINQTDRIDYLYPTLDDPNFNVKIAERKEFGEYQYDGKIYDDIEKRATMPMSDTFELQPHQLFAKNFISNNTPFNSLLLYHGLGSGKTCTSIGICEESREYMKHMGTFKKIIIVASPNVRSNFKKELFNRKELKKIDGTWNIKSCVGNKLIDEIDISSLEHLSKEQVAHGIENTINKYYKFLGYVSFANLIMKIIEESGPSLKNIRKAMTSEFGKRIVLIDEVHNIRISTSSNDKFLVNAITKLVEFSGTLKLLLLSATPMYNTYKEIIWLINLMNMNDNRGLINHANVFDESGHFVKNDRGVEIGKELLMRKLTGYVSYVRGENPYTFPYRIYPNVFLKPTHASRHTFTDVDSQYPSYLMNGKICDKKITNINVYLSKIGSVQSIGYQQIINHFRKKVQSFTESTVFKYTIIKTLIQSLNIIYPTHSLLTIDPESDETDESESEPDDDSESESEPDNDSESESEPDDDKILFEDLPESNIGAKNEILIDKLPELAINLSDKITVDELPKPIIRSNNEIAVEELPEFISVIDSSDKNNLFEEGDAQIETDELPDITNMNQIETDELPDITNMNQIETDELPDITNMNQIETDELPDITCPTTKDLNPNTNECEDKCNAGYIRDEKFKCKRDINNHPDLLVTLAQIKKVRADIQIKINTMLEKKKIYKKIIKIAIKNEKLTESDIVYVNNMINVLEKYIRKIKYRLDKIMKIANDSPEDCYNQLFDLNKTNDFNKTASKLVHKLENIKFNDGGGHGGSDNAYVNIKDLVGKQGLDQIMNSDNNRDFEYNPDTIKTFGRIFSKNEIGKYSSKLKSIHDNIIESTGIVLIFSEYIDAGIIPIALMLEEMGMSRYNNVSLFKTPPTPQIDSITLKPKTFNESFNPATYVIISGDNTLSPSNEADLSALKDDDNKYGKNVKVVLISRAGAEGIDYKNIRQIHVLDPWYNMNRIEQIIGRGVRNFSHAGLPFEERNVQIFLHSTLLRDNTVESADLYIYRVAEQKAKIMGYISRAIKESAIDCILNIGQQNFIKENFQNNKVTQKLSNGLKIKYAVGDEPYSAICDYMKTCQYKCIPTTLSNKISTNSDTTNESFIAVNVDKIIVRIKSVMKMRFFFTRKEFITYVNVPKPYPIVQIYYALSKLIDNRTIIYDMYGRPGYILNIGQYYLFQPSEIINEAISIYDRSVPIDIKPQHVQLNIHKQKETNKSKETSVVNEEHIIYEKYTDVIYYINNPDKIKRTRGLALSWDLTCAKIINTVVEDLSSIKINIDVSMILKCVVFHFVDMLSTNSKISIMNRIVTNKNKDEDKHEFYAALHEYINTIIHVAKINDEEIKYTLIFNNTLNKNDIYVMSPGNKWVIAKQETIIRLMPHINNKLSYNNHNDNIGFIHKPSNEFKIQTINNKRSSGATCGEMGKKKTIKFIENIIGIDKTDKTQQELCVFAELMFRVFNLIEYSNKKWFVTHEEIFLNSNMKTTEHQ